MSACGKLGRLLREVCVRPRDIAARYGGEEFAPRPAQYTSLRLHDICPRAGADAQAAQDSPAGSDEEILLTLWRHHHLHPR